MSDRNEYIASDAEEALRIFEAEVTAGVPKEWAMETAIKAVRAIEDHCGDSGGPRDAEHDKLVHFFREEERAWGLKGDYENWSTERAAIELIRHLRADPAAEQDAGGDGTPGPAREAAWVAALRERLAHLDEVGETVVLLKTSELRALLSADSGGPREACAVCGGSGESEGGLTKCPGCNGSGIDRALRAELGRAWTDDCEQRIRLIRSYHVGELLGRETETWEQAAKVIEDAADRANVAGYPARDYRLAADLLRTHATAAPDAEGADMSDLKCKSCGHSNRQHVEYERVYAEPCSVRGCTCKNWVHPTMSPAERREPAP